jgi:hypothetical protein
VRKSKEVILTGIEPIAMKEMTAAHFPTAIRLLKELVSAGDVLAVESMAELVLGHYQEILEVLVDCSSLTADQFREVGASDLMDLVQAWVEANESFFDRLKGAVPLVTTTRSAPSSG